jgi:hypothetical protein
VSTTVQKLKQEGSKRQPIEGRVKVIVEKFGSARKFSNIVENTKFDTEV